MVKKSEAILRSKWFLPMCGEKNLSLELDKPDLLSCLGQVT